MFSTILKFVPGVLGLFAQVAPGLFGGVAKKANESPGASLATVLAGGGLFSNPHFNGFVADMLVRLAETVRQLAPAVGG